MTPLDEVELSTPHEPQCRRSLLKDNDDFWDALDAFDDCLYDSDGNMPPESTEADLFHFEESISTEVVSTAEPLIRQENIVIIDDDEIKKMKVDSLKAELRKRGISTSGKKAELVDKLKKAMVDKIPLVAEMTCSLAPNGFDQRARWRLLSGSEVVNEPENKDPTLLDPSQARDSRTKQGVGDENEEALNREAFVSVKKKNYSEKFKRESFSAEALQPVHNPKKNSSKKSKEKKKRFQWDKVQYEKRQVKDLIPNMKFLEKHRLNDESHPADWLRAFIPELQPKGDSKACSISKWCQYTNMKAEMDFAGSEHTGGLSYKFVPFTPRELEQHLSLYIVQGLNPSPQLKMKTKAQCHEPVQGIDLVAEKIGINFERRHKQFKRYFAIQHPYLPVPSQKTHPNWKVDPFLQHLNVVFIQAVHLPECISCDEQTIGFHGACAMKQRIKFKKTGDGFQVDTLCSNGYTYTFYFRHQPAPSKYLNAGYAPLHARVQFMFDQLKSKHHSVFMDNLYMSALFARRVIASNQCVKIHGVTRKEGKGIPTCVRQFDVKDDKMLEAVRNTVRVAVLEGDEQINDLVAISFYDSKPVYFLSTVVPEIKWEVCGKKIFSKQLKEKVTKKFLRPNFVNVYNYDMNSVDRADHLRKNYALGQNLRQRKWWWSIFLWGLDVAMVNSYLLYKSYSRYSSRKKQKFETAEGSALKTKSTKTLSSASLSSLSTRMTRSTNSSFLAPKNAAKKKNCTTLNLSNLKNG